MELLLFFSPNSAKKAQWVVGGEGCWKLANVSSNLQQRKLLRLEVFIGNPSNTLIIEATEDLSHQSHC